MKKNDYFSKLELRSILNIKNDIENILIIKNKYFLVKTLNEISVYLVDTNNLKFKIPLNEDKERHYNKVYYHQFIFDFNYKLRLINNEENINTYKLLTDKYLIEINLNKNLWKIINKLEKGIYISNLDILINDHGGTYILDQKKKLKKRIENIGYVYGIYEIKNKYLIINDKIMFRIFDINNYELLYSKKNYYYPWGYKHPYILNDQTIVFSSLLNPYINNTEKYIFVNLNDFSERLVKNIPYHDYEYDSCNQLFIIHKFNKNIYLQYEYVNENVEERFKKRWSIVEENNNKLSFIKKFDTKNLFGDNLYFLSDHLILSWNFMGNIIKFVYYD